MNTLVKTTPFQSYRIQIAGSGEAVAITASVAAVGTSGMGAFRVVQELTMSEMDTLALISTYEADGFSVEVPKIPVVKKAIRKAPRFSLSSQECDGDKEFFDDQHGYLGLRR